MKGFTPTGAAKSATGARQSIATPRAYKFDITFIKKGKFERFLTRKKESMILSSLQLVRLFTHKVKGLNYPCPNLPIITGGVFLNMFFDYYH